MKVDLNCLDPGNVHLNNLNAPVLNVLIYILMLSDRLSLGLPASLYPSRTHHNQYVYASVHHTSHATSIFSSLIG